MWPDDIRLCRCVLGVTTLPYSPPVLCADDAFGALERDAFGVLAHGLKLVAFDFDGVFTDNSVYVLEDGREMVRCSRSDGLGVGLLKPLGLELVIISTETNPVVSARARKLGIACVQGCDDKLAALDRLLADKGLERRQAAFLGNDVNDLACLRAVGLPVAVADSHPAILPHVRYRTQAAGGYGAVREFCDALLLAITGETP